jgi:hypothetical protein
MTFIRGFEILNEITSCWEFQYITNRQAICVDVLKVAVQTMGSGNHF